MKIHEQIKVAKGALESVQTELQAMRDYINSDKFRGEGSDYIRVGEVAQFIQRVQVEADFDRAGEKV